MQVGCYGDVARAFRLEYPDRKGCDLVQALFGDLDILAKIFDPFVVVSFERE